MWKPVLSSLLALFVAPTGSGCIGEPCVSHDLSVYLVVEPDGGTAPLQTDVSAVAEGFYCGCCGGRAPTNITEYAWDFDDDGTFELRGADTSAVALTLDAGVHTISVTVFDSAGDQASASATVTVCDAMGC